MNRAVFLDRDGVINREKNYVHRSEDFEFLDGVFDALLAVQAKGYLIVVITNQAGIARGYYTEYDYRLLNEWMLERFSARGVRISGTYYCPHHPEHGVGKYRTDCDCRKPRPGMLLQAARELEIDLKRSVMVGDKESDIMAGVNAGVGLNVLVRSGHAVDEKNTRAGRIIDDIRGLPALLD